MLDIFVHDVKSLLDFKKSLYYIENVKEGKGLGQERQKMSRRNIDEKQTWEPVPARKVVNAWMLGRGLGEASTPDNCAECCKAAWSTGHSDFWDC